jgi:putative heme iron utilization protein
MAAGLQSCPVLLLSRLARHTRNIMLDARASLLIDGTGTDGDPVTGARVTLEGVLATTQDPQDRQAFLAAHLSATDYCDFADFAFWRLTPHRAFLIEGFGRIHELDWAAA